jgi:DNA-binding transcriptional MerR regulator
MQRDDEYRVGELAERAGLTVRTLHHWHEIGLLKPARRTMSGHRLYGEAEVLRVQHIVALKSLGFSLEEVGTLLRDPDWNLERAIERQIEHVEREISRKRALRDTLEEVAETINRGDWSSDLLLNAIHMVTNMEEYYTKEQLEELAERREMLGEDAMAQAQKDWEDLFARFREEMEAGTPPDDPAIDALLAEQRRLIEAFTGGNPEIEANLRRMYEEQGVEKASHGMMDAEVAAFIGAARQARD